MWPEGTATPCGLRIPLPHMWPAGAAWCLGAAYGAAVPAVCSKAAPMRPSAPAESCLAMQPRGAAPKQLSWAAHMQPEVQAARAAQCLLVPLRQQPFQRRALFKEREPSAAPCSHLTLQQNPFLCAHACGCLLACPGGWGGPKRGSPSRLEGLPGRQGAGAVCSLGSGLLCRWAACSHGAGSLHRRPTCSPGCALGTRSTRLASCLQPRLCTGDKEHSSFASTDLTPRLRRSCASTCRPCACPCMRERRCRLRAGVVQPGFRQ